MNRIPKMAWIVSGLGALGLALWMLGVPGQPLLTFGLFGAMMLMHGGHGGSSQHDQHGGHGGHGGSDRLPGGSAHRPGTQGH